MKGDFIGDTCGRGSSGLARPLHGKSVTGGSAGGNPMKRTSPVIPAAFARPSFSPSPPRYGVLVTAIECAAAGAPA